MIVAGSTEEWVCEFLCFDGAKAKEVEVGICVQGC